MYSGQTGVLSLRIYSRMSVCGVSVCQRVRIHRESHAVVCIYHHWRGQAFVAYLHEGAMRRPDDRDKHARDITPTSFLFPEIKVKVNSEE